jgi:hypothetical protein
MLVVMPQVLALTWGLTLTPDDMHYHSQVANLDKLLHKETARVCGRHFPFVPLVLNS